LPIRAKVDEVYRKLNRLCDILDGKSQVSHDPNSHGLMICESNEFLDGLKKLYGDSDANEQVRLMTIAPKAWGRQKIEKWCVFYPHVVQYLRIFQKMLLKISFTYQVRIKAKSSSTIACSSKKQWNFGLSTMSTGK
jgi:hypothetical protein